MRSLLLFSIGAIGILLMFSVAKANTKQQDDSRFTVERIKFRDYDLHVLRDKKYNVVCYNDVLGLGYGGFSCVQLQKHALIHE